MFLQGEREGISFFFVVLVGHPKHRFVREVIHDAMYRAAVRVVVVPISAADFA